MPSILIADDEPDILAILAGRFRAAGFDVVEARNGSEALDSARSRKPDLVLLDVMMLELNGFQVCRRIKSDPAISETPVVLLTAKDSEADRFWGSEVGADLYLTKPMDPAGVVARIRELLSR